MGMLRSLLLSRDETTTRMITRGFKDLDVELEHCAESDQFLARALETRFDAIVVDDQVEEAHLALAQIVSLANCGKAVRIVLAEHKATMPSIFKTGSQIVLYKPLSSERVRQGLRAVRNLMARERRRGTKRVLAMVPARIGPRHARLSSIPVLLADLSDSGAAIRYEKGDLPVANTLSLEFTLPGTANRIHCIAELVWQDYQGTGGVRFVDMPSVARQQLADWLSESQKPGRKATSAKA
jgi:ActR/RegA family two-component response regulator